MDGRIPLFVSELKQKTVWVFSGHGAQWTDMGKELLNNEAFYKVVEPLDDAVQK